MQASLASAIAGQELNESYRAFLSKDAASLAENARDLVALGDLAVVLIRTVKRGLAALARPPSNYGPVEEIAQVLDCVVLTHRNLQREKPNYFGAFLKCESV